MNKKAIIIGAIIVIGLFALVWLGRNNQAAGPAVASNNGNTGLVASESLYDFGTISMANGKVNKIFKISNPTNKDVTLATIVTSCMCTAAYVENGGRKKGPFGMVGHGGSVPPVNEVIKAGGSLGIKVVYDPNAHGPAGVGSIDRFVYLTDAGGGKLQLEIKTFVTP